MICKPEKIVFSRKFAPENEIIEIQDIQSNGFNFAKWDPDLFGLNGEFGESAERDLRSNLTFKEGCSLKSTPFSGTRVLHKFKTKCADTVMLLECLELFHLYIADEAEKKLNSYLKLTERQGFTAHPLLLLALSRNMRSKGQLLESRDFIEEFLKVCPKGREWLRKNEIEGIQ